MHFSELTPPEQRVLGCLIEKRWTTPDQYPLSLNALRLACNQSTNRDPVTHYDETTVREAAQRLCRYGLARLASGHSSRAIKYRHLAEEALSLGREELAVLSVLLLRGTQTPGELKARSDRMARIDSLAAVEQVLATLTERGFARRLDRRPGQKEDRFEHLFGGSESGAAPATAAFTEPSSGAPVGEAVPSAAIASASNPAPAPIVMRHPAAVPAPGSSAPGSSAPGSSAPGSSAPGSSAPGSSAPGAPAPRAPAPGPSDLEPRVQALESELANLREEAASLREELSALRREVQVGSASPTT